MLDERIGPNRTGAGYVIGQVGQCGSQTGSRFDQRAWRRGEEEAEEEEEKEEGDGRWEATIW